MRNIKLVIEYDGTAYSGWQVQPNGVTIQAVMEDAIRRILKTPVTLRSAGRTDAGVHARGMVACFKTDKATPIRAFSEGINAMLPADIAVRDACEVSLFFNARADAVAKHYRYTIVRDKLRSPLIRNTAWRIGAKLDIDAMRVACEFFLGEHDFAAFRASNCAALTTIRKINSIELLEDDALVHIDINGSGFLKHMVRVMVGTLVDIGFGRRKPQSVAELLICGNRKLSGMTAPAHGLCLMKVFYPSERLF